MTDGLTLNQLAEKNALLVSDVEQLNKKLLAYEQAAKNPVMYKVVSLFGDISYQNQKCKEGLFNVSVTPLYAAPVLPKQPECSRQHFESLCNQFWNWAEFDEINPDEEPRLEWNGSNYTHRVTAALWKMYQSAPAQPVIPGQLTQRMAEEKALSLGAVLNDEEADVFADGWNECRAEMLKAQPVSEPYKLEIDMDDADHFSITHLHEIIYGKKLIWPEAKLLARFMLDVKQRASAAPARESE